MGGALQDACGETVSGPEVEVLSLATMRWSATEGEVPPLPAPRSHHVVAAFDDGRVVVAGGRRRAADPMQHLQKQAIQWVPGSAAWTALADMGMRRSSAVAVALPDGRMLVAGGVADRRAQASVEVLAADGSGWEAVKPMSSARAYATAGLLPSGRVIVAGGIRNGHAGTILIRQVEQWNPVEDTWSVLAEMAKARYCAAGTVLADGRFAVIGGIGADNKQRKDGEVFDPAVGMWEALPEQAVSRYNAALVPVAGGMVAIGGLQDAAAELYDVEDGRWMALPRWCVPTRQHYANVISVPASALASSLL